MACGYCKHPGFHAQTIPLGVSPSKRCGDCRICQAEAERERRQKP